MALRRVDLPSGAHCEYCLFAPASPCIFAACSTCHGHVEVCSPAPIAPCLLTLGCGPRDEGFRYISGFQNYAVVTGGNRGVGYAAALALAQRGHRVIILCRNHDLGVKAAQALRRASSCGGADADGRVLMRVVDLGDLTSVQRFTDEFREAAGRAAAPSLPPDGFGGYGDKGDSVLRGCGVSILVNNAGLIGRDAVRVNHFGHAALTLGLLQPLLVSAGRRGACSTVVHVASTAHSMVRQRMDPCARTHAHARTSYTHAQQRAVKCMRSSFVGQLPTAAPFRRLPGSARGLRRP